MKNKKIILSVAFLSLVLAPFVEAGSSASNIIDSDSKKIRQINVPSRNTGNKNKTLSEVEIFSGEPCLSMDIPLLPFFGLFFNAK